MKRFRVLIADDQDVLREALAAAVRADPKLELVASARDADEAIAMAEASRPDVAVLDVKMPRGGGGRATREIRARLPQARVLAYSAYSDRETVFELLGAGASGYVVKGARVEELLAAIHNAATGLSSLSPEVAGSVIDELAKHLQDGAELAATRARVTDRLMGPLAGTGFTVVYQPIFELATQTLFGYEALTRFLLQPVRPPNEWFDDAASVGLTRPLELVAIRRAIAGRPVSTASGYLMVNVSPETLLSGDLATTLAGAGPVVVELTEHAAVDDYAVLNESVNRLRQEGALFAVDDTGAGFASLRHILRLEPDIIKLDISLTRDIHRDKRKRALATGLISFATESGIEVVAEGIEEAAELEAMTELGARYGQGFLLGRPGPLPTDDLDRGSAMAGPALATPVSGPGPQG